MNATPEDVVTWPATPEKFERMAQLSLGALLAVQVAAMDPSALEGLADGGVLLVDEAMLLAGNYSFGAIELVSPTQTPLSEEEVGQLGLDLMTPLFGLFDKLNLFTCLHRHMLRLPPDGRGWAELTHAERVHVGVAYVMESQPMAGYAAWLEHPTQAKRVRKGRVSTGRRTRNHMH